MKNRLVARSPVDTIDKPKHAFLVIAISCFAGLFERLWLRLEQTPIITHRQVICTAWSLVTSVSYVRTPIVDQRQGHLLNATIEYDDPSHPAESCPSYTCVLQRPNPADTLHRAEIEMLDAHHLILAKAFCDNVAPNLFFFDQAIVCTRSAILRPERDLSGL
jgi:hypothetical protein